MDRPTLARLALLALPPSEDDDLQLYRGKITRISKRKVWGAFNPIGIPAPYPFPPEVRTSLQDMLADGPIKIDIRGGPRTGHDTARLVRLQFGGRVFQGCLADCQVEKGDLVLVVAAERGATHQIYAIYRYSDQTIALTPHLHQGARAASRSDLEFWLLLTAAASVLMSMIAAITVALSNGIGVLIASAAGAIGQAILFGGLFAVHRAWDFKKILSYSAAFERIATILGAQDAEKLDLGRLSRTLHREHGPPGTVSYYVFPFLDPRFEPAPEPAKEG